MRYSNVVELFARANFLNPKWIVSQIEPVNAVRRERVVVMVWICICLFTFFLYLYVILCSILHHPFNLAYPIGRLYVGFMETRYCSLGLFCRRAGRSRPLVSRRRPDEYVLLKKLVIRDTVEIFFIRSTFPIVYNAPNVYWKMCSFLKAIVTKITDIYCLAYNDFFWQITNINLKGRFYYFYYYYYY